MMKFVRTKALMALVCGTLLMGCGDKDKTEAMPDEGGADAVQSTESPNQPPKFSRVWFEPETPTPGGVLNVKTNATDPDGDLLKFTYAWRVNGRPVTGGDAMINLENLVRGDRLEVTVSTSDGKAPAVSKTLAVTLGNQAPVVRSIRIAFSDGESAQSSVLVATPNATDSDGDELTYFYRWSVNGQELDGTGETFDTRSYKYGDKFQVTVIANDGELDSHPVTSDPIEMPNRAPTITSTPPSVNAAGEFRYQVKAEDPDGDRLLRYSLGQGPEGMTVDSVSGEVFWKPSEKQVGTHTIVIAVKDSLGTVGLQEFRLDIRMPEVAPPETVKPAPAEPEEETPDEDVVPTEEEPSVKPKTAVPKVPSSPEESEEEPAQDAEE